MLNTFNLSTFTSSCIRHIIRLVSAIAEMLSPPLGGETRSECSFYVFVFLPSPFGEGLGVWLPAGFEAKILNKGF